MTARQSNIDEAVCPCGSKAAYSRCCGRYLDDGNTPRTAEQLMRSRYSAFVRCNVPYLMESWHPRTRPVQVHMDDQQRWLGLSVRAVEGGGENETSGTVEFVARFKIAGKGHRMHEISRFEKISGRWYYLDGQHL